ncbi:MAG: hypothetical protein E2O68_08870 [Deltaproteobacteria bacterium]|nr:MAG: hypothetical protein E2O68_08870 [Deltaproteobacteria bacterium]
MKFLLFTVLLISCASYRKPASDITNTPKLKFILNDYYLALHTIRGSTNWKKYLKRENKNLIRFAREL